jgi:hypothetical protein
MEGSGAAGSARALLAPYRVAEGVELRHAEQGQAHRRKVPRLMLARSEPPLHVEDVGLVAVKSGTRA